MYLYASHLPACQVLDENCKKLHDTTLHDRLMEASNLQQLAFTWVSVCKQRISAGSGLYVNSLRY